MTKKRSVIKHSACIQVTGNLSLLSRKTFNVLLANAYDNLPDTGLFRINVSDLFRRLDVKTHDYEILKKALTDLRVQKLSYDLLGKDGSGEWFNSSLLADAGIKNGVVSYEINTRMRGLLYDPRVYARINLLVQTKFKCKHTLTLFELCVDWLGAKRSEASSGIIPLDKLRELFGTEKSYPQFNAFNRSVLKPAIREINKLKKKTGITVEIEKPLPKHGRKVIGVKFLITKVQRTKNKSKNNPIVIDASVPKSWDQLRREKERSNDETKALLKTQAMEWYDTLSTTEQDHCWDKFKKNLKPIFLTTFAGTDGKLDRNHPGLIQIFWDFLINKKK